MQVDAYRQLQPEVDAFLHFYDVLQIARLVEYGIYSCLLPSALGASSIPMLRQASLLVHCDDETGWTLSPHCLQIAECVNESLLESTLAALATEEDSAEKAIHISSNMSPESLIRRFERLSSLVIVGENMLRLAAALKRGLWFDQHRDAPSLSSHSTPLFAIAVDLKQDIWSNPSSSSKAEEGGGGGGGVEGRGESVFARYWEMKSFVSGCGSLPPHMMRYLNTSLRHLENEFIALQYEYLTHMVLAANSISGHAGELLIPKNAPSALKTLVDLLERADPFVVNGSMHLKSGLQSAKLFGKFLKAHLVGDLQTLVKLWHLMSFMNGSSSLAEEWKELSPEDVAKPVHFEFLELLRMDDDFYSTIFAKSTKTAAMTHSAASAAARRPKKAFSATSSSSAPQLRSLLKERRASIGVAAVESAESVCSSEAMVSVGSSDSLQISHSFDFEEVEEHQLKRQLKAVLGVEAVCLRGEVAHLLPLLHSHMDFELSYAEYLTSITDTPAKGNPPSLSCHVPPLSTDEVGHLKVSPVRWPPTRYSARAWRARRGFYLSTRMWSRRTADPFCFAAAKGC